MRGLVALQDCFFVGLIIGSRFVVVQNISAITAQFCCSVSKLNLKLRLRNIIKDSFSITVLCEIEDEIDDDMRGS